MRPVRYEDFSLGDLTAIRNLLRGGSVIDWHRLYFTDRDEVDRFLRVNEAICSMVERRQIPFLRRGRRLLFRRDDLLRLPRESRAPSLGVGR